MLAFIVWTFLLSKCDPDCQLAAFNGISSPIIKWAAALPHCSRNAWALMTALERPHWCPDSWFAWPWACPELLRERKHIAPASHPDISTRVRRTGGDYGQCSDSHRACSKGAADRQQDKLSQPVLALMWGKVSTSDRVLFTAETTQCWV